MIERRHKKLVRRDLGEAPAVVLLGPRQVGKTTLARAIASEDPETLYVDLEDPTEASRFSEAREYLDLHRHRLVILDEVQLLPGFPDSFTAGSDGASMRWRGNFIRTYLERDLPQSGLRAPAEWANA